MTYFFQYIVYFYATSLAVMYLGLMVMSYFNILRYTYKFGQKEEEFLKNYPDSAPFISIVAPAFDEEVIIVDNVRSLLNLDYPNYEVIIVNDGSKDRTLDLMIEAFDLVEVPYYIVYKVFCRPIKRIFRSSNPAYSKLCVVDKEKGGTKADAMNAGVNIVQYNYFINTDVDCILSPETLSQIILPVLGSEKKVVAVGATMRMVNGCHIENGKISEVRPSSQLIPLFQETEYLRSYLIAKMGWSMINAIPNVSGGFGLFDTDVVIKVGGFDSASHAEDMDMTARIIAYMCENNLSYRIVQSPYSCCWTEGPPNIKVLNRQRTRWGRGLLQFIVAHRKFLFNPTYGKLGFIIMPYIVFFEFLAPVIELGGLLFSAFLFLSNQINFDTFWILILYVYSLGFSVSIITVTFDLWVRKYYRSFWQYLKLILFSALEPILYHPFIVIFTLRGYLQYLTRGEFKWGIMTRKGLSNSKKTKSS